MRRTGRRRARRVPVPRSRRVAGIAAMAVAGLLSVNALPAFAADDDAAGGPVETHQVQTFQVPARVQLAGGALAAAASGWGASTWTSPATGVRRDGFGPRLVRPVAGVNLMHRGQDLGAACGDQVRAANSGTVVQAGWFGTYGNWVLIDHGNGVFTGYAHAQSLAVRPGQQVEAGQLVALAGTTGASTGCHVHFEVRSGGAAVDPRAFFERQGFQLGRP